VIAFGAAAASLAAWSYLLAARGAFWRCAERDDADATDAGAPDEPAAWPTVAVIVPARNEADVIGETLGALLQQDYRGEVTIVVVDDDSTDGTARVGREAARRAAAADRVSILDAPAVPPGWTGKLWALHCGIAHAASHAPDYLLLTDADIHHSRDSLRGLVARARAGSLVLASRLAKLRCESLAERALVPAFVFFFRMLYPFAWVNAVHRRTAAAAGGCMLVRRDALAAAGVRVDASLVAAADFTHEGGARAMRALLATRPDVDAVFAASDAMAAGALSELLAAARRVPEDVALVGYDDSPIASATTPPLTSVRQPIEEMGREMARLLLDAIERGERAQRRVVLATELVPRASTEVTPRH